MNIPHNHNAEISALGSMLLSEDALDYCKETLVGNDFWAKENRIIFECICNMRGPVDTVLLVTELDKLGKLNEAGDVGYISGLLSATPSAANVKSYAEQILECSMRRKLIKAGYTMYTDGQDNSKPIQELMDESERRVFEISIKKAEDTLAPVKDGLLEAYQMIAEAQTSKGQAAGVQTGFLDLDRKIGGFRNSDLVIIAGRPSMGKTSFAMNIAQFSSLVRGKSVAVFSLEMSRKQLISRMLISEARKDSQKIMNGEAVEKDITDIAICMEWFEAANLYIDDSPLVTVSGIRSKCRKLKASKGLDMVVIDYLQLMKSPVKIDNRNLEVSEITRSAKLLAKELNIPVVLLSQLSRAPEKRGENRPELSDLRDSGAIEQDADVVIMLYREKAYDEDADDVAEILIKKNRNGQTGKIYLTWVGEHTTFRNYTGAKR